MGQIAADVTATSAFALAVSSKWNSVEIIRLLYNGGGDIGYEYPDRGRTELHLAADEGRLDIVEYLFQKGVDTHLLTTTQLWQQYPDYGFSRCRRSIGRFHHFADSQNMKNVGRDLFLW